MSGESSAQPKPTPARRSGVVVPNLPKWHQRLLARVIWLAVSAVSGTIRYRLIDPNDYFKRKGNAPSIYCIWHNRLALCVKLYALFARPPEPSPGLAGLVSASKDGALLVAIFECFGVHPVRGSSSRRGAQALLELSTCAEQGHDLAITPDGPRGPCYKVADGPIALAQFTGLPLVPASYHLNWKITVKSWDRFQIPLPFARCDVQIGEIIRVPRELTPELREEYRRRLEAAMRVITRD